MNMSDRKKGVLLVDETAGLPGGWRSKLEESFEVVEAALADAVSVAGRYADGIAAGICFVPDGSDFAVPDIDDVPFMAVTRDLDAAKCSGLTEAGFVDCTAVAFGAGLMISRLQILVENSGLRHEVVRNTEALDRLRHDLQHVILPIGVALSVEKDVGKLLERILQESKKICNADAGTLYLREGDDLVFTMMRTDSLGILKGGPNGEPIDIPPLKMYDEDGKPNSRNIATHVAVSGEPVNIPDIYNSKDYDWSATRKFDAKNNYRSVSTLTVPLKDCGDRVIGVLQLFNPIDSVTGEPVSFTGYQQLVFESLASQAAIVLSNQSLIKREQKLLVFKRDLEIGRKIQAGFIPADLPSIGGWDIAASFTPAGQVAGDFYDVFELGPDRLVLVVADVCDKGVGAALFASLTRSLLRAFSARSIPSSAACSVRCTNCSPDRITRFLFTLAEEADVEPMNPMCALNMTNDYLIDVHGSMNMFVTMFVAMLRADTGEMLYINAGHEAPLIVSPEGVLKESLAPCGPAVGIISEANYSARKASLAKGDSLVVYTDGLTDARNEKGDTYSSERLKAFCERPAGSSAEMIEMLLEDVNAHIGTADQFDDLTVALARRTV